MPWAPSACATSSESLKLRALAERLHCRLEGDGTIDIVRMSAIDQAGDGDLTFVANPRYVGQLSVTRASAVIVAATLRRPSRLRAGCALLRATDPYTAFAQAVRLFAQHAAPRHGIDRLAAVADDASIAGDVAIGPFVAIDSGASIGARTIIYPNVVIGRGARIGEDCVVHSHAAIREGVVIGHRVIIQNGAVIGSDGFGFATQPDGTHMKILQQADVVIEDDVEIGANTTIDRPAVGETRIRAGTKIDNLVQIGHGVTVGQRVLLASQVGIAGSAVIEDDVVMGGQVGVGGHLRVGRRVVAAGKTVITKSVAPGTFLTGYPGIPNREWRKASVLFRRLPELKKRIEEIERLVAGLAKPKRRRRGAASRRR
jgi:UDP-3-O-[3-hydroxymyristoyl] glucosamine N-acyltransferase